MPLYPHLDPRAFSFDGGDVGVLLVHGLTGAPTELRGLGEHLQGLGYTVRAPLLPGHGTDHQDLEKATKEEWQQAVASAFSALRRDVRKLFVVGQSLGGLLALQLAAEEGEGVDGVVCLAPALMVNRLAALTRLPLPLRFFPKMEEQRPDLVDKAALQRVWSYTHTPLRTVREVLGFQDVVRAALPRITRPLLVMQGVHDKTVRAVSARVVVDNVQSVDKELVWLKQSAHIVSVDSDRDDVNARCAAFIAARIAARAAA